MGSSPIFEGYEEKDLLPCHLFYMRGHYEGAAN